MAELDLGMNLYEFNKKAMEQEKPLDMIAFNIGINSIVEALNEKFYNGKEQFDKNKYWMLLCKERSDYTIFNFFIDFNKKKFGEDLRECLLNRGSVLSIDKLDDGNFEIWIRDDITKENFVYYFFNYTEGVIEIA